MIIFNVCIKNTNMMSCFLPSYLLVHCFHLPVNLTYLVIASHDLIDHLSYHANFVVVATNADVVVVAIAVVVAEKLLVATK